MYQPGDRVVYLTTKHSVHPTPRAEKVQPEPHGEGYTYDVKKYWLVQEVNGDGNLVVVTRRGKTRVVAKNDPRLRNANWWERMFQSHRFPHPHAGELQTPDDGSDSPSDSAAAPRQKSQKVMAG